MHWVVVTHHFWPDLMAFSRCVSLIVYRYHFPGKLLEYEIWQIGNFIHGLVQISYLNLRSKEGYSISYLQNLMLLYIQYFWVTFWRITWPKLDGTFYFTICCSVSTIVLKKQTYIITIYIFLFMQKKIICDEKVQNSSKTKDIISLLESS